jgi:glycosyltransferase involved in cell wall biosynthesis
VKVCAILPAYNEATRIDAVLDIVTQATQVQEVLVVDDGSTDTTSAVVQAHPSFATGTLRLHRQEPNQGKGAAMQAGAERTDAEILVFLDADLIGLKPAQVDALVVPVASGSVAMALGRFRGGNYWTSLAQTLAPNISGQRAIRRDVFLSVPAVGQARYGVELAILNHVLALGLPMTYVPFDDVSHPQKEKKLGFVRGVLSRMEMYRQMMPYLWRGMLVRLRRKSGGRRHRE